jgi:hypothetical protein
MRRQLFSAAEVAQVAMDSHGLCTLMARKLGVSPRTIFVYARRYETVRVAIKEAREATADAVESQLIAAAMRGEPWAVTYYVKTQARDRGYGDTARVDLHVKAEAPVTPRSMCIDYDDFNRRTEAALRLVARIQRGDAPEENEDAGDAPAAAEA